jgi:NTP pyrophosphatase (non-canonical NTP hydrolase)
MNFRTYQLAALQTAIYPNTGENWKYPAKGLIGELGEVAEHLKKMERDDNNILTPERAVKLRAEIGDVLWYIAALAFELGVTLNLSKYTPKQNDDDIEFLLFRCVGHVNALTSYGSGGNKPESLDYLLETISKLTKKLLDVDLEVIMEENIKKLASRAERKVLSGSGSDR